MSGKRIHRFPWPVRLIIGLVILGIILYAGVMGFVLIREKGVATEVPSADNYDAIIVLGAQVKPDGSPSVQLSWRLNYRIKRWYLSLTGNYYDRIYLSYSTNMRYEQNLKNAGELLKNRPEVQRVLVVTSDYHVPRSLALAKDQGYEAVGLGSPCKPEYWLKNHAREALAWIKYWGVKYLHLPLE